MRIKQCCLILPLFFLACSGGDEIKYAREARFFNEYIQQTDTADSDSAGCYVLIADGGCKGCINKVITSLKKYHNCTFILSEDAFHRYMSPLKDSAFNSKVVIDKTDKINRLSFHGGNVGIIVKASGLIDTIITIEPVVVDEQLSAVFPLLDN